MPAAFRWRSSATTQATSTDRSNFFRSPRGILDRVVPACLLAFAHPLRRIKQIALRMRLVLVQRTLPWVAPDHLEMRRNRLSPSHRVTSGVKTVAAHAVATTHTFHAV